MNLLVETDVECPYCGEVFVMTIDTSQGDCDLVEDCSVCCQPISVAIVCRPGEVLGVQVAAG